jgi:hypothetical protein
MQGLLGALMADAMRQLEGLVMKVAEVGHKDAGAVEQEARILVPKRRQLPRTEALVEKGGVGGDDHCSSRKMKEGLDRTAAAAVHSAVGASSASLRDRASATVLRRPDRYSTSKSKLKSLLTHWCWGTIERRWSSKYFRLKWLVRTTKWRPHRYGR